MKPGVQDLTALLLPELTIAARMGLAIAMAIVIGLAFEGIYKREERTSPGGIRTFPMLTVLGIVLYLLEPKYLVPYVAGLIAVSLWLYAHIRGEPAPREAAGDLPRPGLMVPATNLLAYTLGPVALTQPAWVVVAVAVATVLLLESRSALHRLVQQVPSDEIFTLGKFLIIAGVILPLLPDHPISAWTPITPFKAWLALVAVSSLSYGSYLLQRYAPARFGALWPAVLGGAYSSTATTVALAREQGRLGRLAAARSELAIGIIVATAIMYLRIAAVIAFFNLQLALLLLPALAICFALAAVIAGWRWLRRPPNETAPPLSKLPAANPLQLGAAVTFAVLFVILAIASAWVSREFGERGIYSLATITGLTDIDPFVLSLAQGGVAGMSLRAVAAAILVAASSNNVLKACYALAFGGARAARPAALTLFLLAAVGVGLALLYAH
ncbi:MAG TPA: DUF4010 domain-containing protein [Steroidobacteraceae bacterium]|nr:DUF4010 domain-containing protein [Steroidobacteraceae bacterium]